MVAAGIIVLQKKFTLYNCLESLVALTRVSAEAPDLITIQKCLLQIIPGRRLWPLSILTIVLY